MILLILSPRLDAQIVYRHRAEGVNKGTGQTRIGDKRNIEVDGCTAYLVAIAQLACGQILGDIHHHVYFLAVKHIECLRLTIFAGPEHTGILHAVLREEFRRAACSKKLVSLALELAGSL